MLTYRIRLNLVGIINVRKYYIRSYKLTLEADMKQAKVLTEKELKKGVDYINGMDRHAIRNKTMLLLTHYCGMRVNEIANLKKSDVVDDKGNIVDVIYLKAIQTKGNDSRRVFVNKKAKAILKTYLNANLSVIRSDYLFTTQKSKQFTANTLTQLLKRLYEQVGFKNCRIFGINFGLKFIRRIIGLKVFKFTQLTYKFHSNVV